MKVAIIGSRKYENKRRIQEFVFKLKKKYGEELEIVSGGQKDGADGLRESYKYGRPYAVWHYHDRNKHLIEYSDVVVAFTLKEEMSSGTESALKEAIKKEKKYVIIN